MDRPRDSRSDRHGQNTSPEETAAALGARVNDIKTNEAARRLDRLEVVNVSIDSIRPNDYNPNRQSDEDFRLLLRSITDNGFTQPIIVHEESRQIVDGEHRWRAARQLGYTEIPVVLVSMTMEQMKVATLRHNRARGSHDIELEAGVLRDLIALGAGDWAKDALALSDSDFQHLIVDAPVTALVGGDTEDAFGDAWVPDTADGIDTGSKDSVSQATKTTVSPAASGTKLASAMTTGAVEAVVRRRDAAAKAKTEEDRQRALKEEKTYKVMYVFTDEDAEIVQSVLGDEAANKLLELCRRWDAKGAA